MHVVNKDRISCALSDRDSASTTRMDSALIHSAIFLFQFDFLLFLYPTEALLVQLLVLAFYLLSSLLRITSSTSTKPQISNRVYGKGQQKNLRELHVDLSRWRYPIIEHRMVEQFKTSLHMIIPIKFDESATLGLGRLFLLGEKAD